jgi:hypothetical protein
MCAIEELKQRLTIAGASTMVMMSLRQQHKRVMTAMQSMAQHSKMTAHHGEQQRGGECAAITSTTQALT